MCILSPNRKIMPINKGAYRRFNVIDSCLTNKMKPYPSMKDLIDACWEKLDLDVSPETIQKDLRNMKLPQPDGFDAPINFCRQNNGYEYTDPVYSIKGLRLHDSDVLAIKEAIEMLNNIGGFRVSKNFNHSLEKILTTYREQFPEKETKRRIVQTDSPPTARGFEHFECLYKACAEKIPVSFIHYSYRRRNFKSVLLHPILLKEFDNRWYVIGFSENHDSLRTFGLDRIYDPLLIRKKFIDADSEEQTAYFNDIYGIYPIEGKAKQKITINTTPMATNYLEAYPLHLSQKIAKGEHGYGKISFDLIPSMELIRLFRAYGSEIISIQPKWLSDYMIKSNFR